MPTTGTKGHFVSTANRTLVGTLKISIGDVSDIIAIGLKRLRGPNGPSLCVFRYQPPSCTFLSLEEIDERRKQVATN